MAQREYPPQQKTEHGRGQRINQVLHRQRSVTITSPERTKKKAACLKTELSVDRSVGQEREVNVGVQREHRVDKSKRACVREKTRPIVLLKHSRRIKLRRDVLLQFATEQLV